MEDCRKRERERAASRLVGYEVRELRGTTRATTKRKRTLSRKLEKARWNRTGVVVGLRERKTGRRKRVK